MFQDYRPQRHERSRKDRIMRRKIGIILVGLLLAIGLAAAAIWLCKAMSSGSLSVGDPFQR